MSKNPPQTVNDKPSELHDEVMSAIYTVPLKISVVVGHVTMSMDEILRLGRGAVIPLEKRVDDLIEIYVHNRKIALGEIVKMDDGRIGVAIREVMRSVTQGDR